MHDWRRVGVQIYEGSASAFQHALHRPNRPVTRVIAVPLPATAATTTTTTTTTTTMVTLILWYITVKYDVFIGQWERETIREVCVIYWGRCMYCTVTVDLTLKRSLLRKASQSDPRDINSVTIARWELSIHAPIHKTYIHTYIVHTYIHPT